MRERGRDVMGQEEEEDGEEGGGPMGMNGRAQHKPGPGRWGGLRRGSGTARSSRPRAPTESPPFPGPGSESVPVLPPVFQH